VRRYALDGLGAEWSWHASPRSTSALDPRGRSLLTVSLPLRRSSRRLVFGAMPLQAGLGLLGFLSFGVAVNDLQGRLVLLLVLLLTSLGLQTWLATAGAVPRAAGGQCTRLEALAFAAGATLLAIAFEGGVLFAAGAQPEGWGAAFDRLSFFSLLGGWALYHIAFLQATCRLAAPPPEPSAAPPPGHCALVCAALASVGEQVTGALQAAHTELVGPPPPAHHGAFAERVDEYGAVVGACKQPSSFAAPPYQALRDATPHDAGISSYAQHGAYAHHGADDGRGQAAQRTMGDEGRRAESFALPHQPSPPLALTVADGSVDPPNGGVHGGGRRAPPDRWQEAEAVDSAVVGAGWSPTQHSPGAHSDASWSAKEAGLAARRTEEELSDPLVRATEALRKANFAQQGAYADEEAADFAAAAAARRSPNAWDA